MSSILTQARHDALSAADRQPLRTWGSKNGLNQHYLFKSRSGYEACVLVNRFPLHFLRETLVHSYQLQVLPIKTSEGSTEGPIPPNPDGAISRGTRKALKKKLSRVIVAQWISDSKIPPSSYAYDGAHLIHLTSPLTSHKGDAFVEIKEEGRRHPSRFQVTYERIRDYPVALKAVLAPPLSDSAAASGVSEAIRALAFSIIDLVIKQSTVSLVGTETRGDSTYFLPHRPPPQERAPGSSRSDYHPGREQHLRPMSNGATIGKGAMVSSGFKAVACKSISQGRPSVSLSIDATVTAAIPEQSMVEFMAAFFDVEVAVLKREGLRGQGKKEVRAFALEVRSMECRMTQVGAQPARAFSSVELPRDLRDANDYIFPAKVKGEERSMSIADYFAQKYNRPLEYPRLPVLQVKPGKGCMIPAELLVIQPKLFKGKADPEQSESEGPDQTACLVKEGALDPRRRKEKILDIINGTSRLMASPTLTEFGLKLDCDPVTKGMERIQARILTPPNVIMGGGKVVKPTSDCFIESKGCLFCQPATIVSWAVYSHLPRYQVEESPNGRVQSFNTLSGFIGNLVGQGRERGMVFPPNLPPIVYRDDEELREQAGHNPSWRDVLEHCNLQATRRKYYGKSPSFILILLDGNGNSKEYANAKEASLTYGIVSQCISVGRASLGERGNDKGRRAYINTLLLKLNAKLGGVNLSLDGTWRPEPLRGKFISVVGIDVNHDSEEQPSVAALVASVDADCTKYICEPLMQSGGSYSGGEGGGGGGGQRTEIIHTIKVAMRSLLLRYKNVNGDYPEVLIVMRDGVGESQVEGLLEIEAEQIKEACDDLKAGIWLIVLVLEKRHNIRVFPEERGRGRDGTGGESQTRNGNVLPGTIVEGLFTGHSVTDNPYQDFLLVSHSGSIGTVRGVRYTKVIDMVGLTPDEVHRMCFSLTFLMCRSMRPVSLPASLFYADLAAKLARCLLKYEGPDGSDSSARAAASWRGHHPAAAQGESMQGSGASLRIQPNVDPPPGPHPKPQPIPPLVAAPMPPVNCYSMSKVNERIQDLQYFV